METREEIINEDDWIFLEDREIYDGWCARLHKDTKEIVWRKAYFTDRLDQKFRELWEYNMRKENPYFQLPQLPPNGK